MKTALSGHEIVERVAQTLYEAPPLKSRIHEEDWDECGETIKAPMRSDARAAIMTLLDAIRTPSDAMGWRFDTGNAISAWPEMIDMWKKEIAG